MYPQLRDRKLSNEVSGKEEIVGTKCQVEVKKGETKIFEDRILVL